MKAFVVLAALAFAQPSVAAINTCADLEAAYRSDALSTGLQPKCADAACTQIRSKQLRATAIAKFMDANEVASLTDKELEELVYAEYIRLYVGREVFDGVRVSLGDNPFVSFFEAGTINLVKVSEDDTEARVDGKGCSAELEPFLSEERKKALCEQVVPWVNAKLGARKLDVSTCMDEAQSDIHIERNGRSGTLGLYLSRNLYDLGAGGLSCSANMSRKTKAVSKLNCHFHN